MVLLTVVQLVVVYLGTCFRSFITGQSNIAVVSNKILNRLSQSKKFVRTAI